MNNSLGTYVRSRRKTLRMTLGKVADMMGCSVSFLSRLELGQLADGPTLSFLERLATALELNLIELVELKQEDAKTARETISHQNGDIALTTELERKLLSNFRGADSRLQHYIVEQTQLSRAIQKRTYRVPDVSAGMLGDDLDPIEGHLEQLASAYEQLGERLSAIKRLSEAMEAFENAQQLYERTGRMASAGRLLFFKGRVTRELSRNADGNLTADELRYHLATTDYYFSRADQLFQTALEQEQVSRLLPSEKERIPENLMLWALNDIQTARLFMQDEKSTKNIRVETFRLCKERANEKQQRALILYEAWAQELDANIYELSLRNDIHAMYATRQMLAETYHRLASLHSNIAAQEIRYANFLSDKEDLVNEPGTSYYIEFQASIQKAISHQDKYISLFNQAILARRDLALSAHNQEQRDLQINKLSNNHLSLAYAMQHYSTYAMQHYFPQTISFERVLYHLLLAERIDGLLLPGYDPEQRKTIRHDLATAESDSNIVEEEMRTAIRRQVEKMINSDDIGTRHHLKLMYETDYPRSQ